MLGLEGLEDRLVMSTATLDPAHGILNVVVDQPNEQITFTEGKQHGKLDVFDNKGNHFLGRFDIARVKSVDVFLTSDDSVIVSDSHGFPFAKGTTVSIAGNDSSNSLELSGSVTVKGDELYVVGGTPTTTSHLLLGGTDINFVNAIGTVTDSVKITGNFQVSTAGQHVTLTGANGTQTLGDLGPGGGSTMTYSHKATVDVEQFAANATVTLDTTVAAAGEKTFKLGLDGANDVAFIAATPTTVTTNVTVSGDSSIVNLEANAGAVSIHGISTTHVNLGQSTADGSGITTAGIQANVNVQGVGLLLLIDDGNTTTQENVKVTPTTISGTGLFGSTSTVVHAFAKASTIVGTGPIGVNVPELQYSNIGKLQILAGQKFEKYSVSGTNFTNPIEIDGSAQGGLSINVGVNASSNLHLVLHNNSRSLNSADLIFAALGATVNRPPFSETGAPDLSGTEVGIFPNGVESAVTYTDFSEVLAIGSHTIGGGGGLGNTNL
jgi:hypothetical protein